MLGNAGLWIIKNFKRDKTTVLPRSIKLIKKLHSIITGKFKL